METLGMSTNGGTACWLHGVLHEILFFNHGTHATNHCVRASSGVKAKGPNSYGCYFIVPRGSKRQVLLYITLSVRFVWFDLFAVSFNSLLDVPTQLSDCRQEPVEKMDRRISGVSYMYWMDFYNEIFCCGFLGARLISVSFLGLFSGYHAEGYHARTDAFKLTG